MIYCPGSLGSGFVRRLQELNTYGIKCPLGSRDVFLWRRDFSSLGPLPEYRMSLVDDYCCQWPEAGWGEHSAQLWWARRERTQLQPQRESRIVSLVPNLSPLVSGENHLGSTRLSPRAVHLFCAVPRWFFFILPFQNHRVQLEDCWFLPSAAGTFHRRGTEK